MVDALHNRLIEGEPVSRWASRMENYDNDTSEAINDAASERFNTKNMLFVFGG